MVKFNFYGHSCFSLTTENNIILVDPFFTDNPLTKVKPEDIDCQYILVSHAHFDHLGDAPAIAARTGATIIAIPEVLKLCGKTANTYGMNIGGSHSFPFGMVRMTLAIHSCGTAGGIACGFVINFKKGPTIYYSGDTALFSDMQIIGAKEKIDYAILPIGDNFTMGKEDAARSVQLLKAHNVIPVHYNTWPAIRQDPKLFKQIAESLIAVDVHIVEPGKSLELTKW
ncbi:metal-dependent hydrolase [Pectinatus frisingensis]|uniref:metal-dependent hydrolase n=1 Tax=Pectinatus frisingensis TaxID=865 RepID=UPI0018C4EEE2|nr:metal-dependent hydrolase [Pectinatus frisingensis]